MRGFKIKFRFKFKLIPLLVLFFLLFPCFPLKTTSAGGPYIFQDDFTSGANGWTPSSGGWTAEDGAYKQQPIGENKTLTSSPALVDEDFTNNPAITGTPFEDNFTINDPPPESEGGQASKWKNPPVDGNFSVTSNEYKGATGSWTLNTPIDPTFESWTDYRVTAKIKRTAPIDPPSSSYSIIYFRLTGGAAENSYALLIRNNLKMDIYKRSNGALGPAISSNNPICSDNEYHYVNIIVIGPSIKVWFNNTVDTPVDEGQSPNISIIDSSYSAGTIGVGIGSSSAANSTFDDIKVETLTSNWSDRIGKFYTSAGSLYAPGGSGRSLSVLSDTSYQNWTDYTITTKFRDSGAVGGSSYTAIYFRVHDFETSYANTDSYALIMKQDNTMLLYKVIDNWTTYPVIGSTVPIDLGENVWHTVVISVTGPMLRVWFGEAGGAAPDTNLVPTFENWGLTDYASGTAGVGHTYSSGASSEFDDFTVENNFSVEAAPSHIYSEVGNKTTLTIDSSIDLDHLAMSAVGPSGGTPWTLDDPDVCDGLKVCSVDFPDDFGEGNANISALGTYTISASNIDGSSPNDSSKILLEVREKPLAAFFDISDTHVSGTTPTASTVLELNSVVSDINNQKNFPTPNFVTVTGDLSQNGTSGQLTIAKTTLDSLDIPYYPMVGNHDVWDDELNLDPYGTAWASVFGPNMFSYSWIVGNNLFMAMDVTTDDPPGKGQSLDTDAHLTFLTDTLDANSSKNAFLFSHFGLKGVGDDHGVRDDGDAETFWQGEAHSAPVRNVLENHGKAIAQFAGHDHLFMNSSEDGISYFTVASLHDNQSYKYIEIYADRMEQHVIKESYNGYDPNASLWLPPTYPDHTDSTHAADIYSYGLPRERQSNLNYTSHVNDYEDGITTTGEDIWNDYSVQADITLNKEDEYGADSNGENAGGVIFRYTDDDNYYSVIIDSSDTSTPTLGTIKLYKKNDGVVEELGSANTQIDIGSTYTLKTKAVGSTLSVYLDDVDPEDPPLFTVTDASEPFLTGKVGLRSYLAPASFDNVIVTDESVPTDFNLLSPANNSWTNVKQPTFSWQASSDPESGISKYQLYVDGFANTDDIHTTSATPLADLPDESHTWYIIATNGKSTTKQSTSTWTIGVDTISPAVTSFTIPSTSASLTIPITTFTATDERSGIASYLVNESATTPAIDNPGWVGTAQTSYTVATSGTKTLYAWAKDNAGNISASASASILVDTTAPTVPGTPSTTSLTSNNKPTWNWTASTDSGSGLDPTEPYTLQWSTDPTFLVGNVYTTTSTTNSFTHSDALNDGVWYFHARAKDAVGNSSAYSTNGSITIDTYVPPTPTPAPTPIPVPDDTDNTSVWHRLPFNQEVSNPVVSNPQVETPKTTVKEKVEQEVEKIESFFARLWRGITNISRNLCNYFKNLARYGNQIICQGLKHPKHFVQSMFEWCAYSAISFKEIVLDHEPTKIADVKVEKVTATTAIISWKTNHLATSKVNFGKSKDYGKDIQETKRVHDHQIEITGLEPGQEYFYEVISQGKNYVYDAQHQFTTPQETNYQPTFKVVAGAAKENIVNKYLSFDLELDSQGEEVKILQQKLADAGYFSTNNITGYFGPLTQEAVIDYQKDQEIDTSGGGEGIVGVRTRTALNFDF